VGTPSSAVREKGRKRKGERERERERENWYFLKE
jgi:hypothetical protein